MKKVIEIRVVVYNFAIAPYMACMDVITGPVFASPEKFSNFWLMAGKYFSCLIIQKRLSRKIINGYIKYKAEDFLLQVLSDKESNLNLSDNVLDEDIINVLSKYGKVVSRIYRIKVELNK